MNIVGRKEFILSNYDFCSFSSHLGCLVDKNNAIIGRKINVFYEEEGMTLSGNMHRPREYFDIPNNQELGSLNLTIDN